MEDYNKNQATDDALIFGLIAGASIMATFIILATSFFLIIKEFI